MNRAETAKLLTLLATYDRRTIGEADVHAWHSILERYPFDDCARAVKEHYAATPLYAMPAHIVDRVKHNRADAIERQRTAQLLAGAKPTPESYAAGAARVAKALDAVRGYGDDPITATRSVRATALTIACPYCKAKIGEACFVPGAEGKAPLTKLPAHPSRIESAS